MSRSGGKIGGGSVTFPLTSAGDQGFQPGGVASNALTLHNPASAVNGITFNGSATGATPALAATGTDANISLELDTKGTGALIINGAAGAAGQFLQSNGAGAAPTWGTAAGVSWPLTNAGDEAFQPNGAAGNMLTLHNNGGAVNGILVTGQGAGQPATIAPGGSGSDNTINMVVTSKGAGSNIELRMAPGASSSHMFVELGDHFHVHLDATGIGLNYVTCTSTDNGGAPSLVASNAFSSGTDANIDLTIGGKGTGVINFGYATTAISGTVNPATLAATTGGATGPATAAQNSWLAVKVNGTTSFLPVWR